METPTYQTFIWLKEGEVIAILEIRHLKKEMMFDIKQNKVVATKKVRAVMSKLNKNGSYYNEEVATLGKISMKFMIDSTYNSWQEFITIINKLLSINAVEYIESQR